MANARAFIGSGDLSIRRIVAGAPQPIRGPFAAQRVELKPVVEKKEMTSRGRYDYGDTLESANLIRPAEFTLELSQVDRETLLMAFMGEEVATSQAASAIADVVVDVAVGEWAEIGSKYLSNVVVTDGATVPVTYVAGVDYVLNTTFGWIKALEGGALAAAGGETVEVSATVRAASGTAIRGSRQKEIRVELFLDGANQVDGSPVEVQVYEAILAPDSAFDFLAEDFAVITLTGTLKTPANRTEPYVVRQVKIL